MRGAAVHAAHRFKRGDTQNLVSFHALFAQEAQGPE
jgi:hypothetical protein